MLSTSGCFLSRSSSKASKRSSSARHHCDFKFESKEKTSHAELIRLSIVLPPRYSGGAFCAVNCNALNNLEKTVSQL